MTSSFLQNQNNKTADSSSPKIVPEKSPIMRRARTSNCFKRFCSDDHAVANSPKDHSPKYDLSKDLSSNKQPVSDGFQSKLDRKLQNVQNPSFDELEMTDFRSSATVDEFYQLIFDQNYDDGDQNSFGENPKMDPLQTFTSLMDFDFFSSVRQPWRRIKDVDINFIV